MSEQQDQGHSAMPKEAKTPSRTVAYYSRLSIWVALLFIALGLSMQSLQVNMFTQATLDKEYADAMAQQMAQSLSLKLSETQMQQQNAARHPNTIAYLETPDPSWKRTLKTLISGAEQVFILDDVTAMGLQDQLGYAVQEMATRTLRGKEFPLEAVTRNGASHYYLSTPIRDYSNRIAGILLIEYGDDWLEQLRSGAAAKHGLISVVQVLNGNDQGQGLTVFESGQKSKSRLTLVTQSINDYWFLTFAPADTRPQLTLVPIITPWVFALISTLVCLFVLTWMQKKAIKRNQFLLLTYVRNLYRKGENKWPDFSIRLFYDLGKSMEHLAQSKNLKIASGEESASDSQNLREKQTIELSQQANKKAKAPNKRPESTTAAMPQLTVEEIDDHIDISPDIFRSYDIRGIQDIDLNADVARQIGRSLGSEVQIRGHKKIIVARDGRISSPQLSQALQEGLLQSGCDVIDIGQCPTGTLYFATHELDTPCGVMVTGSHNPANYNGFKIVLDQKTLAKEALMSLYHRIVRGDFRDGQGHAEQRNLEAAYLDRIQSDINLSRPLKIVLDAGNGVAGPAAQTLFTTMGLEVIPLYCDVDGHFPNHTPDPSDMKNLQALQQAVKDNQADLGIALDGDGDRLGLVNEVGEVILPDRILMLLAKDIISRNPGCDVIYDIKSSRRLNHFISQFGGRPTMWKTGHTLMKLKMAEQKALLGGELSGHFYFRDRWYGFDDGLYAAARVMELISFGYNSVSELFREFPDDVSTAEITVDSDEHRKFEIITQIAGDARLQQGARVSTIDGIRSDFKDGWGLIRASNTTPRITMRFAGDDANALQRIQSLYKQVLLDHAPELQLPF